MKQSEVFKVLYDKNLTCESLILVEKLGHHPFLCRVYPIIGTQGHSIFPPNLELSLGIGKTVGGYEFREIYSSKSYFCLNLDQEIQVLPVRIYKPKSINYQDLINAKRSPVLFDMEYELVDLTKEISDLINKVYVETE